jgi:hypothetical protein
MLATRGNTESEVALNLLDSLHEAYTAIAKPSEDKGEGAE